MRNTSDGLSTVANGLTWSPGDNLVTFRKEFPSNIYPWLRLRNALGVEVRMCEERDGRIDLEELIGLIDSKTRVVAISQVQYASGFRADLERIGQAARSHDAFLVVDVIQAMGVMPTSVEPELIDVAAAAADKWLLTPEGVGLLYLSDRARERLEPTLVGWISVPEPEDYGDFEQGWNRGALAWETGTGPSALIHGLEASLRLLVETGVGKIANHLELLTDHLCERLQGRNYQIVSSRHPSEKSRSFVSATRVGLAQWPFTLTSRPEISSPLLVVIGSELRPTSTTPLRTSTSSSRHFLEKHGIYRVIIVRCPDNMYG